LKLYSAASLPDSAPEWSESSPHHYDRDNAQSFGKRQKDRSRGKNPQVVQDSGLSIEVLDDSEQDDQAVALPSSTVRFCSRSEAICAEMLLRYVPHFELRDGVTFQVAIGRDSQGNTLAVDFLVDGVLFEYHPVRLFKSRRRCGDFNSKREYRAYADICHSLKGEQREFFQSMMRARLARNYYAKRRSLLDEHPMYRRMELIVATCPEEFYFLVLKRFGRNIPRSVERFQAIFEELRESLPEE
jgi:hypothetical protein